MIVNEQAPVPPPAYHCEQARLGPALHIDALTLVTLRQGLKLHGFFRLSSVREWLRNGAWLRLVASRSGGGKARNQCLHSGSLVAFAVPGPLVLPCLTEREEMARNFGFWRPGEPQHPHLSMLNPGERAHQGGGFS